MDLHALLNRLKPLLKQSSRDAYVRNLEKLAERISGSRAVTSIDFLKDKAAMLPVLEAMPANTRRNYLNTVIVFLQKDAEFADDPTWKHYSKMRDEINKDFTAAKAKHTKTAKQTQNWLSPDEFDLVLTKYKDYLVNHRVLQKRPEDISAEERRKLMEYVLIRLYKEIPSRNDFHSLKIVTKKAYNDGHLDSQNYLVMERANIHLVLHQWKTKSDATDRRVVPLSADLQKLIRAYMRKMPHLDFMFTSPRGNTPLTRNALTKMLTRIFKVFYPNKNISSTMLRNMYLSHKYGDTVAEMKKDEIALGHGGASQKQYIKTD